MKYVYISGTVKRTTDKAILFIYKDSEGLKEKWFPRSVLDDGDAMDKGSPEIGVADWFVEKEGIDV